MPPPDILVPQNNEEKTSSFMSVYQLRPEHEFSISFQTYSTEQGTIIRMDQLGFSGPVGVTYSRTSSG